MQLQSYLQYLEKYTRTTKKIKISECTPNGKTVKIANEGIYRTENGSLRGSLFVELNIEMPKKLSAKQKQIIKEFSEN